MRDFDPPAIIKSESAELKSLVKAINASHKAVERSRKEMLAHARDAGENLTQIKSIVGHGHFKAWIADNLDYSYDTARNYMKVAEHWAKVERAQSLREAMRIMADNDEEDENEELQEVTSTVAPEVAEEEPVNPVQKPSTGNPLPVEPPDAEEPETNAPEEEPEVIDYPEEDEVPEVPAHVHDFKPCSALGCSCGVFKPAPKPTIKKPSSAPVPCETCQRRGLRQSCPEKCFEKSLDWQRRA